MVIRAFFDAWACLRATIGDASRGCGGTHYLNIWFSSASYHSARDESHRPRPFRGAP